MSSYIAKIKRFQIMIDAITKGPRSKVELLEQLHRNGIESSSRTVDRDLEDLRREFDLDIIFDKRQMGYTLVSDESRLRKVEKVLALLNVFDVLEDNLKQDKGFRNRIQTEPVTMRGTHLLDSLIKQIRKETAIRFEHLNYAKKSISEYEVYPIFLKEYAQRWYLIAWVPKLKAWRTFGLDRIYELTPTNETFDSRVYENQFALFDNLIGISYNPEDCEVTEITLRCKELQWSYIESAPWHHSLKWLKEEGDWIYFTLHIIPNYEFYEIVLGKGAALEIVSPPSVMKQMKKEVEAMYGVYGGK